MNRFAILMLGLMVAVSWQAAAFAGRVVLTKGDKLDGDVTWTTNGIIVKTEAQTRSFKLTDIGTAAFAEPDELHEWSRQGPKPTIKQGTNVIINQSADDALNGKVPQVEFRAKKWRINARYFSDAVTNLRPYYSQKLTGSITWDLGEQGADTRQLDAIAIWLDAHHPNNNNLAGSLQTSLDGKTFTKIPGGLIDTSFRKGFRYLCNYYRINFPNAAVRKFRYLRLQIDLEARIIEVDARVSKFKPTPIRQRVVLSDGSQLVGQLKSLDKNRVVLKTATLGEQTVALADVASVQFIPIAAKALKNAKGTGVVLASGDFLDCELEQFANQKIKVNSLLFGIRQMRAGEEALAFVVGQAKPRNQGWELVTIDNTRLHLTRLSIQSNKLQAKHAVLGDVKLPSEAIATLRRLDAE